MSFGSLSIVFFLLESIVVEQHGMENVEKEKQQVIVEKVNLTQRAQHEVEVAASLRQRQLLLGQSVHLLADLGSFFLQ